MWDATLRMTGKVKYEKPANIVCSYNKNLAKGVIAAMLILINHIIKLTFYH